MSVRWLLVAVACLACLAWTSAAVAQPTPAEITVPLSVKGVFGERTVNLAALEYRPAGSGPFPAIVLSHGSPPNPNDRVGYSPRYPVASAVFVKWGFAVVIPVRRGYGKTGGAFEETFGRCESPFYVEGGLESAKDIEAGVAYLRRQSFVDPERIVLVGQSAGGWGSLALASRGDAAIRGVVNFAGGRGGKYKNLPNNNCAPDQLVAAAGVFGKTVKVPSLWLYTENDQFFAPDLSRRMHAAFTASGAAAAYHLFPAIGNDGHSLITFRNGVPLWEDKVHAFFREIGVLPPR